MVLEQEQPLEDGTWRLLARGKIEEADSKHRITLRCILSCLLIQFGRRNQSTFGVDLRLPSASAPRRQFSRDLNACDDLDDVLADIQRQFDQQHNHTLNGNGNGNGEQSSTCLVIGDHSIDRADCSLVNGTLEAASKRHPNATIPHESVIEVEYEHNHEGQRGKIHSSGHQRPE
jgi:hypothetical protein